ncbi:MAG: hypothetical protein IPM50_04400 [Acidobacteriota bacterium]|nr:MAG: hypothetical protein IPM50_04400 [Acidobacteriota bacterium]
MIYLDPRDLARCIDLCFLNARNNADFTPTQRQNFLFRGKILRGHFVNLVSASWRDEYDADINAALTELKSINRRLADTTQTLNNYADTIQRLADVTAYLENLLSVASKFI